MTLFCKNGTESTTNTGVCRVLGGVIPISLQVGGYLAFIGLFCLEAALGLSSGRDIRGIETWGVLLNKR